MAQLQTSKPLQTTSLEISEPDELDIRRLLLGIGIGLVYWLSDALFIGLSMPEQSIADQILNPPTAVFWQRTIAVIFLVVFTVNYHRLSSRWLHTKKALAISENRYAALVEGASQAIFILDTNGRYQFLNETAAQYLGGKPAKLVGKTITDLHHTDTAVILQLAMERVIAKGAHTIEAPLSSDNNTLWFELNLQPLYDENGRCEAILGIATDISQRKHNETELRRQNEELATLNRVITTVNQTLDLDEILNHALDAVLDLDMFGGAAKGIIFLLNPTTNRLEPAAHRGTEQDHPCYDRSLAMGECLCGLAAQTGEPVISNSYQDDLRHSRRWMLTGDHQDISLPIKAHGTTLGALNVRVALTHTINPQNTRLLQTIAEQIGIAVEKAKLHTTTRQQQRRLRDIALLASETEENERRRLARELHDQVGQNLTATAINLNIIRNFLPLDSPAISTIDEAQMLLEFTTESIRSVMSDLRPPMLDDYGLVATLHWYSAQLSNRTGLNILVRGDEAVSKKIPPPAANAFFRIAQEALNNVAKHAQASIVTVDVSATAVSFRMTISDDGIGLDVETLPPPKDGHGWGHLIMAERAEAIGGQFQIESRRNHEGTKIIVEIPA